MFVIIWRMLANRYLGRENFYMYDLVYLFMLNDFCSHRLTFLLSCTYRRIQLSAPLDASTAKARPTAQAVERRSPEGRLEENLAHKIESHVIAKRTYRLGG